MAGKGAASKEVGIHRLPSLKVPESTQRGPGTWGQLSTTGWKLSPIRQQLSHKGSSGVGTRENRWETRGRDQRGP